MSEHTPEPWVVNPVIATIDAAGLDGPVCVCGMLWPTTIRSEDETAANAERIVSCVNAMTGIDDPAALRERAEKAEAMNIQLKNFFDQETILRREAVMRAEKAEVERDKYQTYWAATIQRAEKAEAERDEWKIECEKSRETIWTVTAQRDEAIGDRDQARDERDEARVVVEYIMCKWLSVVTERDAARAEAERLREALEKIINFNGVCFVTIEHKIERDTIKDIARAALEDAKEPK